MILTIATRLAQFSVIVSILLHAFFNISSRLMGGLIADLPLRAAPAIIYSLVVCGGGVLLGLCFLRKRQS